MAGLQDKMEENIMERAQDLEAMYQLHNVGSGFDGSPSFMQESLPQHREELEVLRAVGLLGSTFCGLLASWPRHLGVLVLSALCWAQDI